MFKLPLLRTFSVTAAGLCCAVVLNHPVTVQAVGDPKVEFPAPSSHSVIKQRIGVTDVEVDYSRPNKNGREVFGKLVPLDAVWRTGANSSTKITFSDTVTLGGKEIPAGKYGLYTIPGADEWTVILSRNFDQWGAYDYKQSEDLVRFTAKPMTLPFVLETFAIEFIDVKEDSAQLCLAWDRTCVRVPLTVDTAARMKADLARAMASPGVTPQLYAQAANYYLGHNLELPQALEWINMAIEKTPNSFAYYGRKASIQGKLGDKAGALASAQKALELAKADPKEAGEGIAELTKLADSFR